MTNRSGYALVSFIGFIVLIATLGSSCAKSSPGPESNNSASSTSDGINGRYVAGVKRSDGVVELFKLEVTRQGNDVNGVLYFLSSMLDSVDNADPQKIDPQIFDSFAGRPPAKLTGKIDGNAVEFTQPERMVVGNLIYTWHFTGQIQGDKMTGQLEENLKNDDKDEASENTQKLDIAFNRAETR